MKSIFEYKLSILFYGINCSVYNHHYIVNDLFAEYKNITCDYILVGEEDKLDYTYDVFVYNCSDPNRQNNFGPGHVGFSPTYEQTKSAVLKFKPKIIIQLSDEFWQENNEIHNLLGNLCNLFLRQHRHQSQVWSYTENTYAIPLGYTDNPICSIEDTKTPQERKYSWSWVGFLKSDRYEMINLFWFMWKNIVSCNSYMPIKEIYELYSESIFVPCGRGNSSLDCFRIYEAMICGAIPVIVGTQEEIDETFCFFDENPPWIYAQSWKEALVKCQEIQFNFEVLEEIQKNNRDWWNRVMDNIRSKITESLQTNRPNYFQSLLKIDSQENNFIKPKSIVYYEQEQTIVSYNYDIHS